MEVDSDLNVLFLVKLEVNAEKYPLRRYLAA